MSGEVDADEYEVADFIANRLFVTGVESVFQFLQLFFELVEYGADIGPVEAEYGRLFLDLASTVHGRIGGRVATQRRRFAAVFFLLFELLPPLRQAFLAVLELALGPEHVWMPAPHFFADTGGDVVEIELPLFLGDSGMENDIEQQVAQLFLQVFGIVALDSVE